MEDIRTAIRRRGMAPSLISRPAKGTLLSVSIPSFETSVATPIPRLVLVRSRTALAATETRLPVLTHLTETRVKMITQLTDLTLSISPTAMATQPSVLARSKTIFRATTTSPWVTRPVAILTEAVTILILATKVLPARVAPFALAVRARQKPLSPALVARK